MPLVAVQIAQTEPALIARLAFGGAEKVLVPLAAGSLLGACDDGELLAVQRHTPRSLLAALRGGTLFAQCAALREVSRFAYLVLTGGLYPGANDRVWTQEPGAGGAGEQAAEATGWTWASVQGALLTVQEIGVCVVFANGELDYEATILRLANRTRAPLRVPPARESVPIDAREAFLTGLPGIGPEKAATLLATTGSAAWSLYALTDHVRRGPPLVPGVGAETKVRVRDFLGLSQDEELSPVVWQEGKSDANLPF